MADGMDERESQSNLSCWHVLIIKNNSCFVVFSLTWICFKDFIVQIPLRVIHSWSFILKSLLLVFSWFNDKCFEVYRAISFLKLKLSLWNLQLKTETLPYQPTLKYLRNNVLYTLFFFLYLSIRPDPLAFYLGLLRVILSLSWSLCPLLLL